MEVAAAAKEEETSAGQPMLLVKRVDNSRHEPLAGESTWRQVQRGCCAVREVKNR